MTGTCFTGQSLKELFEGDGVSAISSDGTANLDLECQAAGADLNIATAAGSSLTDQHNLAAHGYEAANGTLHLAGTAPQPEAPQPDAVTPALNNQYTV